MRVELDVNIRPAGPDPTATDVAPELRAENQRRDREDRWLRRIALARVIEARIVEEEFTDLADVARRCRVSRARVSIVFDHLIDMSS